MVISRVILLGIEQSGYSRGFLSGFLKSDIESTFIEIAPEWPERSGNHDPEFGIIKIYPKWSNGKFGSKICVNFSWFFERTRVISKLNFRDSLVICNSGISLLPMNLDLILARFLGAKVVMLCGHGSESRSPIVSSHQRQGDRFGLLLTLAVLRKKIQLNYWSWLANFFFCSPMTGVLAPQPFLNQLDLGHPLRIEIYGHKRKEKLTGDNVYKIIHSASSSRTKGTQTIINATNKAMGKATFDFSSFSKLNHAAFLRELIGADLVIDQAFSDYPLPVAAAEAMAVGNVVLVSGFFASEGLPYSTFRPPVVTCLPQNLEQKIVEIVNTDSAVNDQIIDQGRKFIRENFTDKIVATRLLDFVSGRDVSTIKKVYPAKYKYGAGLNEEDLNARNSKPIINFISKFWRIY